MALKSPLPILLLMNGYRDHQEQCHSFVCFWSMLVGTGVYPFYALDTLHWSSFWTKENKMCIIIVKLTFSLPSIHYILERHFKRVLCMYSPKPSWIKKKKKKIIHISHFSWEKNSEKLYIMMEKRGQRLIHPLVRKPKFFLLCSLASRTINILTV